MILDSFLSTTAVRPAGGAALDQVILATGAATVVTASLLWLCLGHRSGRVPWLGRAAAAFERHMGLPGWAALPTTLGGLSLHVALLGMYWDIALHIGVGRDEGPLANPAHYLILAGLYGIFSAGVLAVFLPAPGRRPGPAAVRLAPSWHAPVGGILIAACGAFSLIAFPLDDVWHRLFGQDVTLWGPTHLMLIGGAGMTLVGLGVLLTEGLRHRALQPGARPAARSARVVTRLRRIGIAGGLLIGLSTFQAEFDFGVPQFALVLQPFLVALAAGAALVAARLWIGPGGALAAAAFFLLLRGIVSVVVGDVLGEEQPALPLYLVEALVVEAAALVLLRRPLALGVVSGALIGTAGYGAEALWTHVAFALPWTPALLPEGVAYAVAGGVAGGIAGALLGTGLRGELPRPAAARTGAALAAVAVAACVATGLGTTVPQGVRAEVRLLDERGGQAGREAQAAVRIAPAFAADDATFLTVTSWQGGGLHVDRLEPTGEPGAFRTSEPMPLHGQWKTLIRLHRGRDLAALPVFLPADPAIPARAVPAASRFERSFGPEIEILQRERKDVAGWLWASASAVVLVLYVMFLAALAWGVGRLSRRWDGDQPSGRRGTETLGSAGRSRREPARPLAAARRT